MNDFQSFNDIISDAIRNSSYHSVIISSCVFILYTLIIKIIDLFKAKNRNKPIIEMGRAVSAVGNNVEKLNTILDKYMQNAERLEIDKIKKIIDLAFINYQSKIEHLCRDIIINNNVELNKDLIISNLNQTINTEYYKLFSTLSLYELHDKPISMHLKERWIEDTFRDVINIIYNGQDSRSRISQITNKLSVKSNDYSTYVHNKTFND